MPQFTVTVSEEELKALEWDIYDVQEWIQNAISEKARRTIDILIENNTNLNYKKLSRVEKQNEISHMILETARARNKRLERELLEA